jgi:glycosyltransferase 2 family protein
VRPVTIETWRPAARSLLRWVPGLLITALAFWLLTRFVNWSEFTAALAAIPLGLFLLAAVIYLVSMVIRAAAWQFLLQRKVTLGQAFIAINEGYFFNNILPFRIGEMARAFLLGRRSGLGLFFILSTIVVERFFDLAIASSLLLATLPLALKLDWARPIAALLLVGIGLVLFLLFLAARRRDWVEKKAAGLANRWAWFRRWIMPGLHSILDGFSVLTRVEFFAVSLGILLSSWLLASVRDWILLRSFVPQAPFWWAALGISAANFFGAVPSVMGALGTFELGGTGALKIVGMPGEAALACVLVVHVIHLIFSTIIGAYGLSREGQTITSLYADIRRTA